MFQKISLTFEWLRSGTNWNCLGKVWYKSLKKKIPQLPALKEPLSSCNLHELWRQRTSNRDLKYFRRDASKFHFFKLQLVHIIQNNSHYEILPASTVSGEILTDIYKVQGKDPYACYLTLLLKHKVILSGGLAQVYPKCGAGNGENHWPLFPKRLLDSCHTCKRSIKAKPDSWEQCCV